MFLNLDRQTDRYAPSICLRMGSMATHTRASFVPIYPDVRLLNEECSYPSPVKYSVLIEHLYLSTSIRLHDSSSQSGLSRAYATTCLALNSGSDSTDTGRHTVRPRDSSFFLLNASMSRGLDASRQCFSLSEIR
jgi:hypothetical protein